MSEGAADDRKQVLDRELAAARAERDRYLAEIDRTAAALGEARLRAQPVDQIGESQHEDSVMTILRDTTQPSDVRVQLIRRLAARLTTRDGYIVALLDVVQDPSDGEDVRSAALDALGSAAFQVARFRPHAQAYQHMLRNLVSDADPDLRETAVGILALQHDPEAQQVLLRGLKEEGPLPVDRERAIQLLADDDHLDNLPWLRELYDSGSGVARLEAIRLMSSYPDATETLEGILRNKAEAADIRLQSAASLRNLAAGHFDAIAKAIVTDESDDPSVRVACLTALQHLGQQDNVYGDAGFIASLQNVGNEASTPELARRARDLVERSAQRAPR
jgi:hypothetical protein